MRKMNLRMVLSIALLLGGLFLTACQNDNTDKRAKRNNAAGSATSEPQKMIKVEFYDNSALLENPTYLNEGTRLLQPTYLEHKVGYEFLGWYRENNFITNFDFSNPIQTDTKIYAQFLKTPETKSMADIPLNYYDRAEGKTGNALKAALNEITSSMVKRSYGDAKADLLLADATIDDANYLYGAWDSYRIKALWDSGQSWNREHVWACAKMKFSATNYRPDESTKNQTSDLHNLRAATIAANGAHGDKYYGNVASGNTFVPGDEHKGDVARILFYMYVRYIGLKLSDNPQDDLTMGYLSTLIAWNKQDPVDAFEMKRNNAIYGIQQNRNPFIDHPEYVDLIYQGSTELIYFSAFYQNNIFA